MKKVMKLGNYPEHLHELIAIETGEDIYPDYGDCGMTEFFLPMRKVPTVTHQQKQVTIQNGKPVFYEPASVKAARSKLMAYLGQHTPAEPYTGPIRLIVKWCYPVTGKHTDGEWKTTKPDVDNAQKLLQDCMTELGFWDDDSQIVSLIAEKFWAKIPGIYIRIEEL